MTIDINEQLTIRSLHKLLKNENLKACAVKAFHEASGLSEAFFISTLISIEKKGFIEIGFYKRGRMIKIRNWLEKYPETEDFYIKLTSRGQEICLY